MREERYSLPFDKREDNTGLGGQLRKGSFFLSIKFLKGGSRNKALPSSKGGGARVFLRRGGGRKP